MRKHGITVNDRALLTHLRLDISEILFDAFMYHLECNPMSTRSFIEDLTNAFEFIEKPQQVAIIEKIRAKRQAGYRSNNDEWMNLINQHQNHEQNHHNDRPDGRS